MKQLWAPWRLAFVEQVAHHRGCIFCEKPAIKQDGKSFILRRGRHAYVLMNIYPYNNGHLLIAPYRHIAAIEKLPEPVLLDMLRLVQASLNALRRAYEPEGFNLGVNQGKVAGAGIEHHIHLHIVPRWGADTNFMPLLGETRVLPQHLKASYIRLKAAFNSNVAPRPVATGKQRVPRPRLIAPARPGRAKPRPFPRVSRRRRPATPSSKRR